MEFWGSIQAHALNFMDHYFDSREIASTELQNGNLTYEHGSEKFVMHYNCELVFQIDFVNLNAGKGSKLYRQAISNVWSVLDKEEV